ncbi:FAR1-related sequence 5-like protein, partial [Tanacetum coccineum]
EGCPKEVWLNTLDPKKNDRQVRSSNFRVCGCKARVVFDMVPYTSKYTLTTFDVEHNHELDRFEYKHLSKAERKLTYNEQLFIIKAANANIGAVRAHNLYTGLKGSSSLVHGTQTEFKNFTRGVNCFIGDSDAQMLITRMEQRQEFTKDFSFDYFVEDAELCGLFWADEVAKCNYKEFGDIVSFDATYKTNKYKMVFVPFTAIDNHRRSVTVGSGLLKKETAKAYGWLLRAFKKAFVRPHNIVVTDQDRAMRLAVATKFPESKHRLCMWHIMQKILAKEQKNRYGEKNEAIEKLAMEASIILDSCVHMLRNNEPKLSVFVNKMKAIKSDLEAELPIVPTRTVSDFVQEFMGVKKPDKVKVKNPTGVRPKGREKQKRIKSGREISMKKSMKKIVVPGGSDHVVGGLRDGTSGSVSV